jgi:hypothetical protein
VGEALQPPWQRPNGRPWPGCARAPASSTEAVACDDVGIARFNRIRYRSYDATLLLYAFDLLDLKETSGMRRWRDRLSRWGSKASCRSAGTRPTAPAGHPTGSR